MPDRDAWTFINSFAPWVSGIGTLIVAAVALYLARRDWTIRLRIRTGLRKIFLPPRPYDESVDAVSLGAANLGSRPVRLTGIYWRMGYFRKLHAQQLPPSNDMSTRLPAKLQDGEEANIIFLFPEFEAGVTPLLEELRKRKLRRFACRSIRAGFSSAASGVFVAPLEKPLQEWFFHASADRTQESESAA